MMTDHVVYQVHYCFAQLCDHNLLYYNCAVHTDAEMETLGLPLGQANTSTGCEHCFTLSAGEPLPPSQGEQPPVGTVANQTQRL